MSNPTRRAFLKAPIVSPDRLVAAGGAPVEASLPALNRRAFLHGSVGAAAGVAVVASGPRLAAAALTTSSNTHPLGALTKPSGPPPAETVMAYIRDAARGEVTVLSGTREATYLDPALTKRLLDAAR